jgi:hypothetical protein
VSSPDPLHGVHVAVDRVTPDGGDTPVFLPAERIRLAEALTAYTAGSAYVKHLDDTGQVRVGALALLRGGVGPRSVRRADGPAPRRSRGHTYGAREYTQLRRYEQ